MNKLRLLLRSVYLKGHQDGNLKTTDLSWEDKIVNDIHSFYMGCVPKKKHCSDCESGMYAGGTCPFCREYNQAIAGMKANMEKVREGCQ